MGSSTVPAASGGKTSFYVTLLTGTSYTVPAGVTYLNATLCGGGGGAGGGATGPRGQGGQIVTSVVTTTPGASIAYALGAGGGTGSQGGTTTFTGATSAVGGLGSSSTGTAGFCNPNEGNLAGVTGGAGAILIEYWA
jgi:hypothetical protein